MVDNDFYRLKVYTINKSNHAEVIYYKDFYNREFIYDLIKNCKDKYVSTTNRMAFSIERLFYNDDGALCSDVEEIVL